ncbi:TDT family transporter [Rothia kristinae]|nr:TDT family transporter [Rothia kristinae]
MNASATASGTTHTAARREEAEDRPLPAGSGGARSFPEDHPHGSEAGRAEGRHRPERAPALVPPAGPGWYGAVMGTGILANLSFTHWGLVPAVPILVIGWVVLLWLSVGFTARCLRDPSVLRASVADPGQLPAWGMVSMGILSVGSATSVVLPALDASLTHAAWSVDWVMWILGTALGLFSWVAFALMLTAKDCGRPHFTWGLPIVPPMVSATTGAALMAHTPNELTRMLVCVISAGCFFAALSLGISIFGIAYHHRWLRDPLGHDAAATTFIPLGVVGQSTAAAQALVTAARGFLHPDAVEALHQIAHAYGVIMLAIGSPLLVWAMVKTYSAWAHGAGFVPGWFATTFPVGTCALGAHLMGWEAVSVVLTLLLAAHWLIVSAAGLVAIVRHRRSAQAA